MLAQRILAAARGQTLLLHRCCYDVALAATSRQPPCSSCGGKKEVQCTVVEEKKAKKKKHAPQQPQLQRSLACRATRQQGADPTVRDVRWLCSSRDGAAGCVLSRSSSGYGEQRPLVVHQSVRGVKCSPPFVIFKDRLTELTISLLICCLFAGVVAF